MIRVLAVLLLQLVGCGDKDDSGVPDTDEPQVECALTDTSCTEEQHTLFTCDESCDRATLCCRRVDRDDYYYWYTTVHPCKCVIEDGQFNHELCPENDCY